MIRKEVFEKMLNEIYDQNDRLAFMQYLTNQEEREFRHEEDLINKAHSDLLKKYNKIVSDRLSHETLIKEVKKLLKNESQDMHSMFVAYDNDTLQKVWNVLHAKDKGDIQ